MSKLPQSVSIKIKSWSYSPMEHSWPVKSKAKTIKIPSNSLFNLLTLIITPVHLLVWMYVSESHS